MKAMMTLVNCEYMMVMMKTGVQSAPAVLDHHPSITYRKRLGSKVAFVPHMEVLEVRLGLRPKSGANAQKRLVGNKKT